jgi:molybdopterin-guanine dinucleotide biosynthesis protein A
VSDVSALILAGGRSERFGHDKTSSVWGGQTLLAQVVRLASGLSDDVIVLGPWSRHEGDEPAAAGARVLHDPEPFPGPLVALATGLVHVRHDLCLVLAADMPTVSRRVLVLMLETALADASRNAVALSYGGRLQPLPLLIRARHAYPYLARVVSSGERKLRVVLHMPGAYPIDEKAWQAADYGHETLRDIDTAADYAELLARPVGPAGSGVADLSR